MCDRAPNSRYKKMMRAIEYTKYGSPDVLRLVNAEKPVPKEDEVLIEIKAA